MKKSFTLLDILRIIKISLIQPLMSLQKYIVNNVYGEDVDDDGRTLNTLHVTAITVGKYFSKF